VKNLLLKVTPCVQGVAACDYGLAIFMLWAFPTIAAGGLRHVNKMTIAQTPPSASCSQNAPSGGSASLTPPLPVGEDFLGTCSKYFHHFLLPEARA
jgi:hypothetical protein